MKIEDPKDMAVRLWPGEDEDQAAAELSIRARDAHIADALQAIRQRHTHGNALDLCAFEEAVDAFAAKLRGGT